MRCPRCENVVLEEIDRSGVTVDRCASCRGIWLDRGELEKLLARATAELEQPRDYPRDRDYDRVRDHDRSRDYDREPPSSRPKHHRGYKHKSFWHELFD
jgi:Zn-finger nucleic acid-binding protein